MLVLRAVLVFVLLMVSASLTQAEPDRAGGTALQGQAPQVIVTLKDGTRIAFLKGFAVDAEGEPQAKALYAAFELKDASLLGNHVRLIEIADLLFGGVVMVPADTQGYKEAVVGFLRSQSVKDGTVTESYEDFRYRRGADGVWLRQAGKASWKVAQDPADWKPPTAEIVDLGEYGKVEVPFFGEIMAPPGRKKALGVELYSPTPAKTERKIDELRAYWASLDQEKLTADGFDAVMIQHYEERARGKFHVRQMAFLVLMTLPNGQWPKLPDGPLLPGGKAVITADATARTTFDMAAGALGAAVPASLEVSPQEPVADRGAGLAAQAVGPALSGARYKRR